MRLPFIINSFIASATLSAAGPSTADHTSSRPSIVYHPKTPQLPPPCHAIRDKVCNVSSYGDGVTDDSPYILDALNECNDGGHVIFGAGTEYLIGTALDLTFLNQIDIDIQGTILFSDDTTYWQANSFRFVFQNVTSFFKLGGNDVNIYGGGTLDGNGQVWYDLYAEDIYTLRPVLIGIDGLHNSTISDLVLQYSPQYYNFIANSTNVVFDNINISGSSTSDNEAKNTDGWDTYRSSDITIQNSHIDNGDDCVSFKPNSSGILVQNLYCTGSHGISVGSLGQYVGEYDIVEDVYVFNISMNDVSDGARIKVWPNSTTEFSGDLQGGGGTGMVRNITYDTMLLDNVDYAIEINQCYGADDIDLCLEHPSPLTITDIVFKSISGTTSDKYEPNIATFQCSSEDVCNNISATDIDVVSPDGSDSAYCLNVDASALDVTCSSD